MSAIDLALIYKFYIISRDNMNMYFKVTTLASRYLQDNDHEFRLK